MDSGDVRLKELGYKQELNRDLSVLSNFAFSFSIVSVLTGVTTLFTTGLSYGGPVSLIYGWLIASTLTVFVGLAMGEICSAYPTSGGLYYWSAKLAGPNWAPFAAWITGWFNMVGQWAITTSICFSLAQIIQVIILLVSGGKNGGGYTLSKYELIGIHAGILLINVILNSLPVSVLSFFGRLAASWNVFGNKETSYPIFFSIKNLIEGPGYRINNFQVFAFLRFSFLPLHQKDNLLSLFLPTSIRKTMGV